MLPNGRVPIVAAFCVAVCTIAVLACASPQADAPTSDAPTAPTQPAAAQPGAAQSECANCFQDGVKAKADGDPARAVRLFEVGCVQNDAQSCHAAAGMYATGDGVPEDDARAIPLFVHACELNAAACAGIGNALVQIESVSAEGRALLVRGCEGGDADSCDLLADAYYKELGGPIEPGTATAAFERACALGNGRGCVQAALAFHLGRGVDADLARAREFYELGCAAGDIQSCGNLGVMLRDGIGGGADVERSIPLFDRACTAGASNACVSLGVAHFRGDGGLAVDQERAIQLFDQACQGGDQAGCANRDLIVKGRAAQRAQQEQRRWTTTIGSLTIGSGDQTATFTDVKSTCSPLPLTLTFGVVASQVRACLDPGAARRVLLSAEGGRVVYTSVEPDDAAGRCVVNALAGAPLGELTCAFETSVSR